MGSVALTGKDTIKINGRIITDTADGDASVLSFPNELMTVKTGKNGNSIYAFNYSGRQCELALRVLRGSADDKFLLGLLNGQNNDPAAMTLLVGEFTKVIGDGLGAITSDTYVLTGGVFKKPVDVKENVDGDVEQAVAVYTLAFSNAPRTIG